MKWFDKWFAKKCKQAWEDSRNDVPEPGSILSSKHGTVRVRDEFDADGGLSMRVHRAIGGRIVSFTHYDRKTDRESRSVYIITDEQNFEQELGKIITMESMRG